MGNVLGSFNLDVALTALEQQGRGRLLSTPKVTTQNNQAAEIKQGVQIPIQTVANNTVTTQFKDAVLTLKVTPQITDAGTVILTLEVENSTPDFAQPGERHPADQHAVGQDDRAREGRRRPRSWAASTRASEFVNAEPDAGARQHPAARLPVPAQGHVRTRNNELLLFITPRIVKS